MLSRCAFVVCPGRKNRLMTIARTAIAPPNHHVALLKKSAVLLEPNIAPIWAPPPNVPDSPPPLLDCRSTIIISNTAIIDDNVISNAYIINSLNS